MKNSRKMVLLVALLIPTFMQAEFVRNKDRPNVDGVEFKEAKAVLKPYLEAITDPAKKRIEIERIKQLIFLKEDLAKVMATNPYYTKDRTRILLKKHGRLQFVACTYVKANGMQLNLKTAKDGKFVKLKWSSIPSKTILDMLNSFLKMKIQFSKQEAKTSKGRNSDQKTDLADFALRTALFVEWNLGPKHAKKHVAVVLKYKPDYLEFVQKFLPDSL